MANIVLIIKVHLTQNPLITIAEKNYALVQPLPEDQASEILTFAEFV